MAADVEGTELTLTGYAQAPAVDIDLPGVDLPQTEAIAGRTVDRRHRWAVALQFLTLAVDLLAVTSGYLTAKAVHADLWDGQTEGIPSLGGSIVMTIAAWPVIFAIYGLYDIRRTTHITAELRRLFHAVAMCVLTVVLLSFLVKIPVSRGFIAALIVVCLATTLSGRLLVRQISHLLNSHAMTSQATIIVGGNDEARAVARTLRRQPWVGYQVLGFVDVAPSGRETIDGLPVLGVIADLAQITARNGVRAVIIAGSAVGGGVLQSIDLSLPTDVAVRVSPGLPNLGVARIVMEPIDGMALFSLRRHRFSRRQRLYKRSIDVALATIMLLVASPVLATLALLVRLTSPGPVLFRQQRLGTEGRPFMMYKFRTMVDGAEHLRGELNQSNEADGLLFKMRNDPRVTRVGRALRRSSLDELPQLLNVLQGTMSLVGPRPALPEEAERYDDTWRGRLRVKPGLTGLWQVNGRHDLVFEDYIRYDLFYVENWSMTMDLYILSKTIPALFSARGSY